MNAILDRRAILRSQTNNPLYEADRLIGHSDDVHENESETLTCEQWLLDNIPFIQTPDKKLDEVYYFRWSNLLEAMGKRRLDGKYEFCESAVGSYYHKYIDCAQGAHIRDARWIRDKRYLNDYLDTTPDVTNYREYVIDSVWQKYLLDGDRECIGRNYEKLKSRLRSLDGEFDNRVGLYHCFHNIEGQECGVNSFERVDTHLQIEIFSDHAEVTTDLTLLSFVGMRIIGKLQNEKSMCFSAGGVPISYKHRVLEYPVNAFELTFDAPVTGPVQMKFSSEDMVFRIVPLYEIKPAWSDQWWIMINGYQSYRVGNNAYQIAANIALAKMARLLNKEDEAIAFEEMALALKDAFFRELWSEQDHFFLERTVDGRQIRGKECCGYAPWAFSIVPDSETFAHAFDYMVLEDGFLSKYGLTSLEKSNPHYMQYFNHPCLWNGPVWPYTFSLALTSFANHLQNDKCAKVNKAQYYDLLCRFVSCHRDSGQDEVLMVRENHHPEENKWLAQAKFYNHSTFADNILAGLFGILPEEKCLRIVPLVPQEWTYFCVENLYIRGSVYTILYDASGEMYRRGKGFQVFRDGKRILYYEKVSNICIEL